jgi:hypothetical protein
MRDFRETESQKLIDLVRREAADHFNVDARLALDELIKRFNKLTSTKDSGTTNETY